MFDFLKRMIDTRKGLAEYEKLLAGFLDDHALSAEERSRLQAVMDQHHLTGEDVKAARRKAFALSFSDIVSDGKITDEEKTLLEDLVNYFGMPLDEIGFDQKAFNKFYTLGLLEKGIIPEVHVDDAGIILKKDERMHWMCPASLHRMKTVTTRVNYGGVTGSIRIMKGVRYRVGSVNVGTASTEILAHEDTGLLWISSRRIGFKGLRKNPVVAINTIVSFDVSPAGMVIAKEGRENPYIFRPDDFDVPCRILSELLNAS